VNALEILRDDHLLFRRLLASGEEAPSVSERDELVGSLDSHLAVHQPLEEEILFPALGETDPEAVRAANRRHRATDAIVRGLRRAEADARWPELVATARDALDEHLTAEEGAVFSAAERALRPRDLELLGTRIETIRDAMIR